MSAELFERIVTFTPAFDRRDPNPHKDYGIHGVELRMVLKGTLGAVQFVLYTNWHLPHVVEEQEGKIPARLWRPMPADLGYHWREARYPDQEARECHLLDGAQCFYDGSGLNAEPIYQTLLREGSEGVWRELETYYLHLAKECP